MAIFTGPPQKAAHFFGQLRGDVGSRFSHAKVEWTRMDHAAAAAWLAVFFLAFQEILFFWNLEIPSIIVGKVVGFPGSTPNFQVSFSTETHVPLNRDFERAFFRKGFQFYYFYETLISNGEFSSWMTVNDEQLVQWLGLVWLLFCFPHSDVVLFFDEKYLIPEDIPKTTSKRPCKNDERKRVLAFSIKPFSTGLLSFLGQGRSAKNPRIFDDFGSSEHNT